jgi:hypothetical protein
VWSPGRCATPPRSSPLPIDERFIRDFSLYWGLLAFLASAFGKRTFGPSFDPGKLDRLSSGLRRLYRRELLRTPSTLLRLSRVKQAYATMFLRHEVVLSPVLAHVTPAIGVLSPRQPFDELLDRLTRYVAFTPLNNVAGSPAIAADRGHGRRAADRRAALGRVRRRADAAGAGVRARAGPALAAHPGLTAVLCSA